MKRAPPSAAASACGVAPRALTLLTTFRCNFSCRHCGYRAGPQRREVMPLALAKEAIAAAARVPTIRLVAFSGGEPFLYPRMLRELVAYAGRLGLCSAVVTNASWAATPQTAKRRLGELAALGLADFTTSVDWFHLEFADAHCLRNAVHAALELDLVVHVNVAVSRNGEMDVHDALRLLELPEGRLTSCNRPAKGRVELKELSPIRVGAARQNLDDSDLIRYDRRLLSGHPCPLVLENPVLNPGGELYACCGFGGGDDRGPSLFTRVGNLGERHFSELLDEMQGNLLLNLIYEHGPYRLIELLHDRHPGLRTRPDYVFSCEVCDEIAGRPDLQHKLAALLRELADTAMEAA